MAEKLLEIKNLKQYFNHGKKMKCVLLMILLSIFIKGKHLV